MKSREVHLNCHRFSMHYVPMFIFWMNCGSVTFHRYLCSCAGSYQLLSHTRRYQNTVSPASACIRLYSCTCKTLECSRRFDSSRTHLCQCNDWFCGINKIGNGNRTEWSTIQGVIGGAILMAILMAMFLLSSPTVDTI